MILRTPPRRAQIFGAKLDIPKNAIDVAIGGKADMPCCTAYVRFWPKAAAEPTTAL